MGTQLDGEVEAELPPSESDALDLARRTAVEHRERDAVFIVEGTELAWEVIAQQVDCIIRFRRRSALAADPRRSRSRLTSKSPEGSTRNQYARSPMSVDAFTVLGARLRFERELLRPLDVVADRARVVGQARILIRSSTCTVFELHHPPPRSQEETRMPSPVACRPRRRPEGRPHPPPMDGDVVPPLRTKLRRGRSKMEPLARLPRTPAPPVLRGRPASLRHRILLPWKGMGDGGVLHRPVTAITSGSAGHRKAGAHRGYREFRAGRQGGTGRVWR